MTASAWRWRCRSSRRSTASTRSWVASRSWLQAPVFIGLFHVLRSFNRTGTGYGPARHDRRDNANTANYFFSAADVQSFLTHVCSVPRSRRAITTPSRPARGFRAEYGTDSRHELNIAAVALPLMIIACIATHFNSRASVARQSEAAAANPQSAIMNKLAL